MRPLIVVLALCISLIGLVGCSEPEITTTPIDATPASQAFWFTNFEQATAQAQQERLPVLMLFTGSDWCGGCIKLKKEVLDTAGFSTWAKGRVVLLDIDSPIRKPIAPEVAKANEALSVRYQAEVLPTTVLISADGTEIGRLKGYEFGNPTGWYANVEKILATKP